MSATMSSRICRNLMINWSKSQMLLAKSRFIRHLATTRLSYEKWHLCSAVCLERTPKISPPLTDMEKRYSDHLKRLEVEYSILSDHELRHARDVKRAEKKKKGEEDEAEQNIQTALDVEDVWEHELQEFKPASRITEADKTNNLKSTERKLDEKLILLVKQRLGDQSHWVLPQRQQDEEPSLREVAEKSLSSCGEGLNATFLGNAPCGFLKYRYGKDMDGHVGSKIFFFKAHHNSGDVDMTDKINVSDYLWVSKDELKDYVSEGYNKEINKFILEL